jgi:ferric-dicitrate binding protein FerR (iron transport regulator)
MTPVAAFFTTRSCDWAWDSAARSAARISLTVRVDRYSSQHRPMAQQRRRVGPPCGIFALGAALAGLADLVEPGLHVACL